MATNKYPFRPYIALGLVSDGTTTGCAPNSHQLGLTYFLTTPVDGARALHLYNLDLQLKRVSKALPTDWFPGNPRPQFSHLAAHHQLTFASVSSDIVVFSALNPLTVWKSHSSEITVMTVVADLLVTTDREGTLITWQLPTSPKDSPAKHGEILSKTCLPPDFVTTSVVHPTTYVNKVLLGAEDGRCLLLNLRTSRVVHIFGPFPSPITVLEPSPVVDVVAVGTKSGSVYLHNFRADKKVVSFHHESDSTYENDLNSAASHGNPIVAMSFRTDGVETLVTADASGDMFIWDLNEKKICCETRRVHTNGVIFADFVPGQPFLVTAGAADNSVKVHVFDESKEDIRLLRYRQGHHLPPTLVRFCGEDGLNMVSAGMDKELRLVCAVHEAKNRPFSQSCADKRGRTAKKNVRKRMKVEVGDDTTDLKRLLPPVTAMALSNAREKDGSFANLVTVHAGRGQAYCWRLENGAFHKHILVPPNGPNRYRLAFQRSVNQLEQTRKKRKKEKQLNHNDPVTVASCVDITPCGNFAIVGFVNGNVHSFNLQSGLHQGVYTHVPDKGASGNSSGAHEVFKENWGAAHEGPVNAVCIDGCGDLLASTGGTDQTIKFWGVHTRKPDGDEIRTELNVVKMIWCEKSDLIVSAMEDFSIYAFDVPTRRVARIFRGHEGPIVDLCLSEQGRRVISGSMDGCIRVWDVPSGCCMNVAQCREAPTSISVSSNGDFLATTHANNLSIRLWVNSGRFGNENGKLDVEGNVLGDIIEDVEVDEEEKDASTVKLVKDVSLDGGVQVAEKTVTLSGRPANVWTVLSHLQEVRERNKPKEPVKKGANAPFFIPTIKGLSFQLDTGGGGNPESQGEEADEERTTSNESMAGSDDGSDSDGEGAELVGLSRVGSLLLKEKFEDVARLLGAASTHEIDNELRGLRGKRCRRNAVKYFEEAMKNGRCFELVQAELGLFLRCHGEALAKDEGGIDLLERLADAQHGRWDYLRDMFDSVQSLSSVFSGQA